MGVTTRSSQTPTKSTKSSEEDDEQFIVQKRPINQSSSSGEEESDSEATNSISKKDSDADSGESETGEDVAQNESQNDRIEEDEDEVENAEEDNEEEEEDEEEDEEEENEEEEEEVRQTRLSKKVDFSGFYGYKCYFANLVVEGKEIMGRFDKSTLEFLFKTPFGVFFKLIHDGKITIPSMSLDFSKTIIDIIGNFTQKGNGFRMNNKGKVVNLEEVDVALIFGMPLKGHKFEPFGKAKGVAGKFEKKYLSKTDKRITKTELLREINTLNAKAKLTDGEKVDLVKLFLLYSFAQFFFCSTNGGVSKMMIRKFEDISYVNNCSWPSIIHSYLMNSMRENFKKPTSISGCVYIILYFVLEHCELMDPIKGAEAASPRLLKWNLKRLTGDNWVGLYNRLEKAKVSTLYLQYV